jgi:acetyl esterase/lipase
LRRATAIVITIVENLAYGAVQSADLIADIAFPSGRTALPAVISIHGGRWIRGSRFDDGKQGRPNNGVIDLHQWAAAGYFAMRIDYRLASCTPAPACFQDAMCAIRWIHAHATEYRIDDDKIFLIGQSAGGHLAALAATLGPDGYERSGGYEFGRSLRSHKSRLGIGLAAAGIPEKIARAYASPVSHVNGKAKPLFIAHAADDASVPVSQADAFVSKLIDARVTHFYRRYDTGGHLRITKSIYEDCQTFIRNVLVVQH